jgi:putative transposase
MPRANRHYIPGYVWHITHRCHKKEFLLKFDKDRRLWLQWLFEAKKRYGLSVLNFTVTSNHIHLLVRDNGEGVIPQSMQLIAGKLGQEYNRRKNRKGAYWEDRYHATAVQTDNNLMRCMVYIDMNMVRAGVVKHPQEWPYGGYAEIQSPRQRYALLDYEGLKEILNFKTIEELAEAYRGWVDDTLIKGNHQRDGKWTESIAVGSELFVSTTKDKLGIKAKGRDVFGTDGSYELREDPGHYKQLFEHEKVDLSPENAHYWSDRF